KRMSRRGACGCFLPRRSMAANGTQDAWRSSPERNRLRVRYRGWFMVKSEATVRVQADRGFFSDTLSERDPELDRALRGELGRLQDQIELIASENVVSRAVLEAAGSVLTNKYAEGYPGRRYY